MHEYWGIITRHNITTNYNEKSDRKITSYMKNYSHWDTSIIKCMNIRMVSGKVTNQEHEIYLEKKS